ncbi:MAG: hypothetical protein ACYC2O_04430 [Microthrixaceae bacterium]
MSRDQPTDLRRGGTITASQRAGSSQPLPDADRGGAPVPEDNRPGHHPPHEQDRPDPDEFVARFQEHLSADDGTTGDARTTAHDGPAVRGLNGSAARRADLRPVGHGIDDGPVVIEQTGWRAAIVLAVPLHMAGAGARGIARALRVGGRIADGVADRLDPR